MQKYNLKKIQKNTVISSKDLSARHSNNYPSSLEGAGGRVQFIAPAKEPLNTMDLRSSRIRRDWRRLVGGFSLAEAMVVLLMITVILAAVAPIVSKKMKMSQTGYSKVSNSNRKVMEFTDPSLNGTADNDFVAMAQDYFVTIVGGGGAGGSGTSGVVDWKTPGTYNWTVPAGVTEIEVTLVSGGTGGGAGNVDYEKIALLPPGETALTDKSVKRVELNNGTWTRPSHWSDTYAVFLMGGGGGGGSLRILENAELQGPGAGGKGGYCVSSSSLASAKYQVGGGGGAGHGVDYGCGEARRLGGYGAGNGGWSLRCGVDTLGGTRALGGYYNGGAYKGEDSSGQSITDVPSSLGTSKGGVGHLSSEPGAAGGSSSFLRGINMAGGGGGALRAGGGGGGGASEFGITGTNCQSAMAGGGGGGGGRTAAGGYTGGGGGGAGGGCGTLGGIGGNGRWGVSPLDGAAGGCGNSTAVASIPELAPITASGGGGDTPGAGGAILIKGLVPSNGGSGGGAGAIVPERKVKVTPGEVLTIVVGKGGAGGAAASMNSSGVLVPPVEQTPFAESSSLKRGATYVLDTNWLLGYAPSGHTMTGGPGGGRPNGGCPYSSDGGEVSEGDGGALISVPGYSVTVWAKSAGNTASGSGCPYTSATPGGGDGGITTIANQPSGWCTLAKGGTASNKNGQSATGFGGCSGGGGYGAGSGGAGAGGYARITWGGGPGGGGGSGGSVDRTKVQLNVGQTYKVLVGASGKAVSLKDGGNGGQSGIALKTAGTLLLPNEGKGGFGGKNGFNGKTGGAGGGKGGGGGQAGGVSLGGLGGSTDFYTVGKNRNIRRQNGVGGCGGLANTTVNDIVCKSSTINAPPFSDSEPQYGAGGGGGGFLNIQAGDGADGFSGYVRLEWE